MHFFKMKNDMTFLSFNSKINKNVLKPVNQIQNNSLKAHVTIQLQVTVISQHIGSRNLKSFKKFSTDALRYLS